MSNLAKGLIIGGSVLFILLIMLFLIPVTTHNRAITIEEQISEFQSNMDGQLQRRYDLYNTLAEACNAAKDADALQIQIVEARNKASEGNVTEANTIIQAVVEAYPQLGSHAAYSKFMTEAPLTENMIANYRESYNNAVRSYKAFTRKWPYSTLLSMRGYDVIDYQYLEYNKEQIQNPPKDLFN